MFLLPPAELSEFNAFETFARLSLLQNQRDLLNDIQTQAISSTSIVPNHNICNMPQNDMAQSHNKPTVILQQFSMIIK